MKHYDIIIIGLGPAGATFARLVPDHYQILAIDAKDGPDGFSKPCGGLLAPDAQKTIAEMGFHITKDLLVDPQIFSVHTIDFKSKLERHYQRAYINVDRQAFDMWCIHQMPEWIEKAMGSRVTSIDVQEGHYIVRYHSPKGQCHTVSARYIVGADGANSLVRRAVYPSHKIRTYLSIQEWYRQSQSQPFYASIFDPEVSDCYSWAMYKDEFFLLGGAYPLDGARERFDRQKEKLKNYGYCLDQPIKREACLVLRPERISDIVTGKKGAYLIGEAAGWISPSSLEGISYALISARELARSFPLMPNYWRLKLKLFGKIMKVPFLYHSKLRRLIMKSGIQSIKVSKSRQP